MSEPLAENRGGARIRHRWSAEEDAIIAALYPDYPALLERLRDRTRGAVRFRAGLLGIAKPRRPWTTVEDKLLRQMRAAGAPLAELVDAFPNRTPKAIKGRCWYFGYQAPKSPSRADEGVLGSIRQRATRNGLTLADLDRLAGSGHYFRRATGKVVLKHIASAASALGGEVAISWEPLG